MNVAVKELEVEKPISKATLKAKEKYEGKVFKTNNYGDVVVLEYTNSRGITVKFINTGNVRKVGASELKKGKIRDNELKPIYKVGIMDIPNTIKRGTKPKSYNTWDSMLQRCYNENLRHLHQTYADCVVSDDFKYYSKFKEWCEKQIGFEQEGWALDKDILVKGNKIYSADNCCFVPQEINCLIISANAARGGLPVGVYYEKDTGKLKVRVSIDGKMKHIGRYTCKLEAFNAYKQAKENHIKKVAEKWREQIDPRVYDALMAWEINIDD